jgi:hypothetical protein
MNKYLIEILTILAIILLTSCSPSKIFDLLEDYDSNNHANNPHDTRDANAPDPVPPIPDDPEVFDPDPDFLLQNLQTIPMESLEHINLFWAPNPNADRYKIYRYENSYGAEADCFVAYTNNFTDSISQGCQDETAYYYKVACVLEGTVYQPSNGIQGIYSADYTDSLEANDRENTASLLAVNVEQDSLVYTCNDGYDSHYLDTDWFCYQGVPGTTYFLTVALQPPYDLSCNAVQGEIIYQQESKQFKTFASYSESFDFSGIEADEPTVYFRLTIDASRLGGTETNIQNYSIIVSDQF